MKIIALAAAFSAACLAASDEPEIALPEPAPRCASALAAPDLASILAVDAPELASGHAALASLAAVEIPGDLDFTPGPAAERSKKRFRAVLGAMMGRAQTARRNYLALDRADVAIETRRSACRGALASMAYVSYQLERAPIPSFGESEYLEEMRQAYCDALDDAARPARERAAALAARCDALE